MIFPIIVLLLSLCINTACTASLPWKNQKDKLYKFEVIRVIDGDSIKVYIESFPENLRETTIRVAQIDTPELDSQAQCQQERLLAIKAKDFTNDLITKAKKVRFKPLGYEKYGRILADVSIDGKNLADALLEANLAVYYDNDHKVNPWCK